MEKKTKIIKLRVSPTRMESLRKRSLPFGNMSSFINLAIDEFSDTGAKEKLETVNRLAELYASIDSKLAHIGGNLNQALKRINESAQAGYDISPLLIQDLPQHIESVNALNNEFRAMLRNLTTRTLR